VIAVRNFRQRARRLRRHFSSPIGAAWWISRKGILMSLDRRGRIAVVAAALVVSLPFAGNAGADTVAPSTVLGWGDNSYQQLVPEDLRDVLHPRLLCREQDRACPGALNGAVGVDGGSKFSLALLGNGSVLSWGSNRDGRLGRFTRTASTSDGVPGQVCVVGAAEDACGRLTGVTAVATSYRHTLAIQYGSVIAWGDNDHGQLGDWSKADRSSPVYACRVSGDLCRSGVRAVAAGQDHSLALLYDGRVLAWGRNDEGQLGFPATREDVPAPREVALCAGGEQ
jgi:alpha-tubulin suppressor-like RCC1 family protein